MFAEKRKRSAENEIRKKVKIDESSESDEIVSPRFYRLISVATGHSVLRVTLILQKCTKSQP